ncbi:hypothetical protein LOK49_LG06G02412 [Camellia lanceoleosa]|uniref:Uncharacterized protein n=1 Tax=Camellia lanceoleosa TaxID=1840588 RepID=A0ACC0HHA4_9ERIC|nr:hypothetical protein LOK49_LG06G02412 [Camellia lanceoleosa]
MKKLIFKQGYVEKSIVSGLQKNLMSAADNERLKIDMEVEWLGERIVGSSLTKDIIIKCSSLDHFLGIQELLQQADKSLQHFLHHRLHCQQLLQQWGAAAQQGQGLAFFHDRSSNGRDLRDRANELYKEGRVSEFMDRKLIPSAVLDQVQLCVHIGIMCTEYGPELRPTMGRVYSMLSENHCSSSTLVEEPMRDGSSLASSTARNSGLTELANNGSSSRAEIHLENEGLPKHRGLTRARRI